MKISELLKRLSHQELSNLSIGMDGAGNIRTTDIPKVIGYINDCLLDIYSRFLILEKELMIVQLDYITKYHLKKQYAVSDPTIGPKYIVDSITDPFTEDVIRILEVWDRFGEKRVLNDQGNISSVFTPMPDTLKIPVIVKDEPLLITYQANHPKIINDITVSFTLENALNQEIQIPLLLEGALQSWIASKIFAHMNGQEHLISSQNHFGLYESRCATVESKDLVNNSVSTTDTKLEARGFI